MLNKRFTFLFCLLMFIISGPAPVMAHHHNYHIDNPIMYHQVNTNKIVVNVLDQGTEFDVITESPLSSLSNQAGDTVKVRTLNDITISNDYTIPANTVIEGSISSVQPAITGTRNGVLGINFTKLKTADNKTLPISAKIQTPDGTGLIRGINLKARGKKQILQDILKAGIGAAFGMDIESNNVELPEGLSMKIVLDKPFVYGEAPVYKEVEAQQTSTQPETQMQELRPLVKLDTKSYEFIGQSVNNVIASAMIPELININTGNTISELNRQNTTPFNSLRHAELKTFPIPTDKNIFRLNLLLDLLSSTKKFTNNQSFSLQFDENAKQIRSILNMLSDTIAKNPDPFSSEYIALFLTVNNPAKSYESNAPLAPANLYDDQILAVMLLKKNNNTYRWLYLKEFPGFEGNGLSENLLVHMMNDFILKLAYDNNINQFVIDKSISSIPFVANSITELGHFNNFDNNMYIDFSANNTIKDTLKARIAEKINKQRTYAPPKKPGFFAY